MAATNGKYVNLADVGIWLGVSISLPTISGTEEEAIAERVSICVADAEALVDETVGVSFIPEEKTHYMRLDYPTKYLSLPRFQTISAIAELDEITETAIDISDTYARGANNAAARDNFRLYAVGCLLYTSPSPRD